MAYHQAHLLMLAGYSSFFVSGLVLPKAEYPHLDQDEDVTMADDVDVDVDVDVDPSVVPLELNEAPATQVPSAPDASSPSASSSSSSSSSASSSSAGVAVSLEKRRKRGLFADQSHVRTISRWLCESRPCVEDRPRQHSMPDISAPLRELHDTKRFCGGPPRPRLPTIQTTGLKVLAA